MPKVSVIVPVYNVQEYLGQCLDTILLQTLQDIEVICVDDGSTDDSLSILNTYAMFDERIKVIHQDNMGLGLARNRGMKDASGDFIIFFDSDDFFHPEMLEKMVTKAEEDGSDMTICGYTLFDSASEKDYKERRIGGKFIADSPILPQNYRTSLFDICSASVWTKLIKLNLIKKYNLEFFDDEYAEDLPFSYIAMALSHKISLLPDCFVHYRQNRRGQLTGNKNRDGAALAIPLMEWYDNLKKFNLEEIFSNAYINRFFRVLAWEVQERVPSEQRIFLNQFIKKLSPEITKIVYGDHMPLSEEMAELCQEYLENKIVKKN